MKVFSSSREGGLGTLSHCIFSMVFALALAATVEQGHGLDDVACVLRASDDSKIAELLLSTSNSGDSFMHHEHAYINISSLLLLSSLQQQLFMKTLPIFSRSWFVFPF